MRKRVYQFASLLTVIIAATAGMIGCGDDSKGRTNDPYYDPYYNQYRYDPYYDPRYSRYPNDPRFPNNPMNAMKSPVAFEGMIYATGDLMGYLERAGLCGKLFSYWTTWGRTGSFGPSNCKHVTQNPVALVQIFDSTFSNNGTSGGSIVLAASHGAYGTQGLQATFRKINDTQFEGRTSYRNLVFIFSGRPTDDGVQVYMREGNRELGEGWLTRSR